MESMESMSGMERIESMQNIETNRESTFREYSSIETTVSISIAQRNREYIDYGEHIEYRERIRYREKQRVYMGIIVVQRVQKCSESILYRAQRELKKEYLESVVVQRVHRTQVEMERVYIKSTESISIAQRNREYKDYILQREREYMLQRKKGSIASTESPFLRQRNRVFKKCSH